MTEKKKIVVIIPAFNEENSVENVLNEIPKELVSKVIVVNNNSNDKTKVNAQKQEPLFSMKRGKAMVMLV